MRINNFNVQIKKNKNKYGFKKFGCNYIFLPHFDKNERIKIYSKKDNLRNWT